MTSSTGDTPEVVEAVTECGLVMPIADTAGYPAGHWGEVRSIIEDALESVGFRARLVSDADAVGVIHARIVKNLFQDDLIICDISSRNPNVMVELGLRLAFDKPTILIRDNETERVFDTDIIEYLPYPKNLRHGPIQEFQEKLAKKARDTFDLYKKGQFETVFLKHFQITKPAHLDTVEAAPFEVLSKKIDELSLDISRLSRRSANALAPAPARQILCFHRATPDKFDLIEAQMREFLPTPLRRITTFNGHLHLQYSERDRLPPSGDAILAFARKIDPNVRWLGRQPVEEQAARN